MPQPKVILADQDVNVGRNVMLGEDAEILAGQLDIAFTVGRRRRCPDDLFFPTIPTIPTIS